MKTPQISTGQAQIIVGLLGLGVAIYAIYETKKAAAAVKNGVVGTAKAVTDYIADDKNVVNGAAKTIIGSDNLQGAFDTVFDFFHPDLKAARDRAARVSSPTIKVASVKTGPVGGVGWGVLRPEYMK